MIGDPEPPAASMAYQAWGWPVTQHHNQVWLNLEPHIVALIMPALLAAQATATLTQQRCLPLVLAHPDTPEHRIVLAGEPYGIDLPWPPGVHRLTGNLPLPPTTTPRGPVTWVHPPQPEALQLCREIDVFAALRTAVHDCPTKGALPDGASPPENQRY